MMPVRLTQKSNHCFTIEWDDGKVIDYLLHELQKRCPCAGCQEKKPLVPNENVRATRIYSLGRYALKIDFTAGCSMGIYSYTMLKNWRP